MNDESKLPVWAQKELKTLREEIGRLKKSMDTAADRVRAVTGDIDSNVMYFDGLTCFEDEFNGLPNDSRIRFRLGRKNMEYIDCTIKKDHNNKKILDVHGGMAFAIRPRSSNAADVILEQ